MQKSKFAIEGMSCDACVRGVTSVLNKLDGVAVERVSMGSAEVSFEPAKTSPSDIADVLTDAGYPARQEQAATGVDSAADAPGDGLPIDQEGRI